MIICLDSTPLTMTSGGLPRYVSELSDSLVREFPEDRFVLSSDQPFDYKLTHLPRLPSANWLERRWWLYGAERANTGAGISLYHGTNFAVPYFPKRPTVLTIHDLSPWMNAEWHSGADRVRNRTPRMIGCATMIITPSKAVKQEVVIDHDFAWRLSRMAVTPLAAADSLSPGA